MTAVLINTIGSAFSTAFGSPEVLGFFIMGVFGFYCSVYRLDRGGIALLLMLGLGMLARLVSNGGFGLIPEMYFYILVAIVGLFSALAMANIAREGG